ncbi:TetR/AcrR family transcriptional regulator [Streptomyces sp. Wb2n-11]|uniref:TetR/AcrR family transcriptional regulator n=1 Tax=Streptomyces sp. Wb2n-11 TaxID=1030533 RepID=UPI0021001A35|nr:TetR/AcrR family transcriptional regulator [Streptomyces sp. Wb2n-11]
MPPTNSLRRPPVQQRSADRLARILDACAQLLDERGYERLSTRAVAARAGVPIGSVYRFFSNKRALADALALRNLDRYAERISGRISAMPGEDWRGAIDAVLDEYIAMKRTTPGFALVDFGVQIPVGEPGADIDYRVTDRLTELLCGHLGRTPDAGLRRTVLVAVEAADALLQLAFRVRPSGDPDLIGETRAVLHAYLAKIFD